MKTISWLVSVGIGVAALSSSAFATPPTGWSADIEKAFEKAKIEKKAVLVEFTGSDYCQPCIVIRKNVLSKPEFITAASKKYILVELDFPRGDKALQAKNDPYAEKYQITQFPTVVLFDETGKEFTRFNAADYPRPELFLKHLDEALEKRKLD